MKCGGVILLIVLVVFLDSRAAFGQGTAAFSTLQNSTVSIPATAVVSSVHSNDVAIQSTNRMLSGVSPVSSKGGSVSVATSLEWVRRYGGDLGNSQSSPMDMALRGDGSLIVCGYSYDRQTSDDFITLCYAADGTPLWTNRFDGPFHGSDIARLLAVNVAGEIWVAGESQRYTTNFFLSDVTLIKYSSNGVPVWTNTVSSFETNSAYPTQLVVDNLGNSYFKFRSSYQRLPPLLGQPIETVIIKYDVAGNVSWVRRFPFSASDRSEPLLLPGILLLDSVGNVVMTGEVRQFGRTTDRLILKLSDNWTQIWTNQLPFALIHDLDVLAIGSRDNIIAVGTRLLNDSALEVVVNYSSDGVCVWTNQFVGPNYDGGNVPQILSDSAGNTFVIAGSANSTATSGSYQVVKIDASGVPLWTNQTIRLGITNSQLSCSAVDHAGNLYLAGHAPVGTNVSRDYLIIKLSGDGCGVWTNRFDGLTGDNDFPSGMAVDNSGSVFVTGRSENPFGSQIATVKFSDSLFYTPPMDFTGVDSIAVTITDSLGADANSVVNIAVDPGSLQFTVSPKAITFNLNDARLVADGVSNEHPVILETSADLKTWQPIATNTPASRTVAFIDSSAKGHTRRFYRMSQRH